MGPSRTSPLSNVESLTLIAKLITAVSDQMTTAACAQWGKKRFNLPGDEHLILFNVGTQIESEHKHISK